MTSDPLDDPWQSLAAGLMLVRQFVPEATSVRLQMSDCGDGFILGDVITAGRLLLSATDPDLLSKLVDATWRYLGQLPWDSDVGEDEFGDAQLDLPDTPIPAKTVWNCLTCGFFSDKLQDDRDTDHLCHDSAHHPNWHTDKEMGFTHG